MKKRLIFAGILLSLGALVGCGGNNDPLTYVFVDNDTDGKHYEVYYNGKSSLPQVTNIASSYNDGSHGELPVKGFYYNSEEDKGAFENCSSLKEIVVPDCITSISQKAFKNCDNLIHFDVGYDSEILKVEKEAFAECFYLTYYRVNPKLKSIGEDAFTMCDSMTMLLDYDYCTVETIDKRAFLNDYCLYSVPRFNEVRTIGDDAFSRCYALNQVALPSITNLGKGVFYECHNLSEFSFGENCQLESIPKSCFFGCRSLESIGIPSNVTTIENSAFAFCSSLNDIIGVESIKTIENYAFQSCTSLPIAPISNSCISIGKEAFKDCTSIGSISIPASTTSIGIAAFNGCINLRSLKVDSNNPNYDSRNDCNAVITKVSIPGETEIPANSLISASPVTTIPATVTSIQRGVYEGLHGVKEISIPTNITEIPKYFIIDCNDLESVIFESGSSITTFLVHTLFSLTKVTNLILPDSLQTLKGSSICYLRNLVELNLPSTITTIESNALYGLNSLVRINYPGSVEQFKEIVQENWAVEAKENLTVYCSDGQIEVYN